MQTREHSIGLTRIEIVLTILLLLVLASIMFAWHGAAHRGDQISQVLNNARQLYIAGFSMTTDFNTSGDDHLGWPGELAERKQDPVLTVSAYIERLVAYEYL